MAIAFGSVSGTTWDTRTNTTITAPSGITDDDQLLFCIITGVTGEAIDATPPAGLTQIGNTIDVDSGGFNQEARLYRKTASGESGNYTFTHASSLSQAACWRYTVVDTATPLDANTTTTTGTGSTTTATGLTTVTAGAMLVFVSVDFAGPPLDPPAGMTERLDSGPHIADVIQAGAGASGNKTQTNNHSASQPWGAWLVALRPAAEGDSETVSTVDTVGLTSNTSLSLIVRRDNDADAVGLADSVTIDLDVIGGEVCFDVGSPIFVARD